MSLTRTTCPYCGVGCGVLARADGHIEGDPAHPANFGRLCSKGAALGETIDLEGRLLQPKAAGRAAGWDEALDLVAERFGTAVAEHGPDAVAFYVSGQLLTEDYYVANKLMKGYIGSANIDTNSRLCMASSVAGHKRAFGSDTVPGTYEDLEEADLVVLVGSNMAWCHPVLYQRLAAAKAQRPNMRVVNIDPRRTQTSDLADLHLCVAPDGDIALFNGLLAYLADHDALDPGYIAQHVSGFDEALGAARACDPIGAGLSEAELAEFYGLWASTKKVVTVYSQGVNQSACGTDKVNAILNCHLATGRIGRPGCGPLSLTGQPNAMGGREVGGLANMLANHLEIANSDHRAAVQGFWQSPTICTQMGLKAVDLFEACGRGEIKALWVMSTNPAVSMPEADAVARAIAQVPFVAVTDIMARTDTGDLADVLLPAAGWGEKNGTVTNSERRISRQRAFLPVPGAARPDWLIISQVAQRMGFAGFDYTRPEDVFAEYVALNGATTQFRRDLDLSAFESVDYEAMSPGAWPANGQRFFADGGFYHPDGKARMVPIATPERTTAEFTLNTGRNRDQWHTMTRTGKAPRLGAHLAEPYLEIHPNDAAKLALGPGDILDVSNAQGEVKLRALPTTRVVPGQVFAPMHWTRQLTQGSTVNCLAAPKTDPISGQPALKFNAVHLAKFDAAWYGFVASASSLDPQGDYMAIARTQSGWQAEIAQSTLPQDWLAQARQLTGLFEMSVAIHETPAAQGLVRFAFVHDGRIHALFFAAKSPVVLSRPAAIAQIGSDAAPLRALAGRMGADTPDPGATICACFNVGRNTLLQAISEGARSVPALGEATCAGTNCGSCKPELAQLIGEAEMPVAAE
ncbi:nitrate reductase [Roseobacteraceae bacterium S113]